ncbi:MFS transporter [Longirhabdus pacifica]|uniref:MFS transporter n=1 Tax=Longirhabdus pacifica TaxID=2305227 RepID=UPI0023EA4E7D
MSLLSQNKMRMFILMLNMFITMVGVGIIIPVLPTFLQGFENPGVAMGLLVAFFSFAQFIFSPIAGRLSDEWGRRLPIIFGLFIFTVSQVIYAFGTELWVLYISRLLGGVGAAFVTTPMLAYIADITTEKERAKGMGLIGASMSLGFVIGPGVGGFLAPLGIRTPFYIAAIIAGIATILSFFMLPETLSKEARMKKRSLQGQKENMLKQLVRSFGAPYFVLLVLVFTMSFGLANLEAIFGLYVDRKLGFTPTDIAIIITVGALIGVVIQALAVDKLVNKFGEAKVINWSFFIAAICSIALILTTTFWGILLGTMVFFTVTSLMRPALNTLLSKMAGSQQGFVAGMNNMYMSLGNMIGPALAGVLFDIQINAPFTVGGSVMMLSIFIFSIWLWQRKQRAVETS